MICTDSRDIRPGDVFVAIPCTNVVSHIQQALQLGASLVFTEETSFPDNRIITVSDAFLVASHLSRVAYPTQPKNVIAITGTNGKSSVAHFVSQIWQYCRIKSANLGTLGLFVDGNKTNSLDIPNLTTPDALHLHKILSCLKSNAVDNIVFEASSAALDQKRLHSVSLSVAAFTNFALDHLDYHKTRKEYLIAKLRLFSEVLPQNRPAVISVDDESLYKRVRSVHPNVITYGYDPKNVIYAYDISATINKIKFNLSIDKTVFENLELNLCGDFQLSNVLTAIALTYSTGIPAETIVKAIQCLTPLNGRMECVALYNEVHVFIDYAHTADGFRKALLEFKKYTANRLICVFGCGGNRDASKRPEMGKIANNLADIVIVTDDNPRNEDPVLIRCEILASCPKGVEIADRQEAIETALKISTPGDTVAIIGKGHETVQVYGNKKYDFNDRTVVTNFVGK